MGKKISYVTFSDEISQDFPGIGSRLDGELPKPVTEADLTPEGQGILGVICQEGDCLDEQPLCPADPRITCQLIADKSKKSWVRDWVKLPWRIVNAKKGDLIMSPGGSGGVIGGLLSQLRPPQHYTHMGIMTRNQLEVRHCTSSEDWLKDHPNGHIILDGPRPSDGFQPDALRYGWPGTITQSIDAAYQASLDDKFAGAAIKDTASGKDYVINALGFEPTMVNVELDDTKPARWETLFALVVKPCQETDAVREALHRIADAAIAIRGHYRFYAYTNAAISEDPKYFGPPMFEAQVPDPNDPCKPLVQVDKTIPIVCSTFIWAAVQRANATHPVPQVVLDCYQREKSEDPMNLNCRSDFPRHPELGMPDPAPTHNGLYFYKEVERAAAGEKLYEYLTSMVRTEIATAVPDIVKKLGGGLIYWGWVISWLEMGMPIGAIATALGISLVETNLLVEWLTDMPDDVANQVANAFASDYCDTDAKDSDNWRRPGDGYSVSPDNIINSWSAPQPNAADPREMLCGLYGYNRKVILRPPKWEIRPLHAWAVSPGPGWIHGQVSFNKKPINGATVKVCCRETLTRSGMVDFVKKDDGVFRMEIPAGDYLATAGFEDPDTGVYLSAEKEVSIPFQLSEWVEFELEPPPASDREVIVKVHMDIVSRVAFGHDWWDHPDFELDHVRVGPYGKPNSPDADMGKSGHTGKSLQLSDYGSVRINVDVEWQPDNSVNVCWETAIFNGDDKKVSNSTTNFNIPADTFQSWIVDLSTGGAWPDRAHIEFCISNDPQP
jgi:hypothetical protein